MTTPNEELINNLTIKAGVMEMGEKIAWGSDTALMRQAAATLQSQAERIATLEGDVEYLQKDINAMCNAIPSYHWSGGAAELITKCFAERDTLRAQLAAIAATEPVAWFAFADSNGPVPLELFGWDEKACKHAVLTYARAGNWKGTVEGYLLQQGWTLKPLFTRPMLAQDVTELVEALERVLNCCDIAECGTVPNSPGALKNARTALSKYKGAK